MNPNASWLKSRVRLNEVIRFPLSIWGHNKQQLQFKILLFLVDFFKQLPPQSQEWWWILFLLFSLLHCFRLRIFSHLISLISLSTQTPIQNSSPFPHPNLPRHSWVFYDVIGNCYIMNAGVFRAEYSADLLYIFKTVEYRFFFAIGGEIIATNSP